MIVVEYTQSYSSGQARLETEMQAVRHNSALRPCRTFPLLKWPIMLSLLSLLDVSNQVVLAFSGARGRMRANDHLSRRRPPKSHPAISILEERYPGGSSELSIVLMLSRHFQGLFNLALLRTSDCSNPVIRQCHMCLENKSMRSRGDGGCCGFPLAFEHVALVRICFAVTRPPIYFRRSSFAITWDL